MDFESLDFGEPVLDVLEQAQKRIRQPPDDPIDRFIAVPLRRPRRASLASWTGVGLQS
jgi:hypothetical protein